MLKLHPCVLSLALLAPAAGPRDPASQDTGRAALMPLEVSRPAPDLGFEAWLGSDEKPGAVIKRVVGGDARDLKGLDDLGKLLGGDDPGKLATHHGKVVLVHLVEWEDPTSGGEIVALVGALASANEDRGLLPLAIAAAGDGAKLAAERAGITWPVATTDLGQDLLDGARSATECTRRAQDLLDRYRGAPE